MLSASDGITIGEKWTTVLPSKIDEKGSAFASLTSVENFDICQKLSVYFGSFLSNVWKLVRSHHRQRNDIHYDALQFPEITNLTSVQLILTNVRMKYLSRHIFSLKQQLVCQNRLWRFDSDKCQWGRCMAHKRNPYVAVLLLIRDQNWMKLCRIGPWLQQEVPCDPFRFLATRGPSLFSKPNARMAV